ncbi:MAG: AbrB/MazE/SpoVT family DNA-binding domain-containing protein [Sulfolobales archaeon]
MRIATRRIVSIGKRSLAVTIPKKWISLLNVRKSDPVILRLNRDGSITIYVPNNRSVNNNTCQDTNRSSNSLTEENINLSELLNKNSSDRILLKEDLASLITKPVMPCIRESSRKNISRYIDITHRSSILDLLEEAFDTLNRYLRFSDYKDFEKIHDIEYKMDILYYSSMRETADELFVDVFNELNTEDLLNRVMNIILTKISEDLIDSVDRIAWRVYDMKIFSRELSDFINKIYDVLLEISGCIRYICSRNEIRDYFNEISSIRRSIRSEINNLPQIYSLIIAELESILNNLENLVETALISRSREIIKRSKKTTYSREQSRP